ncbi:SDR family NAD(P)-dependent oxidoreductase [Actinoplanes couchii]|uniref:Short-chain dehydrogenase n=1 Tax=Actinoplanes couchii TaxID=403638 RepID=A0ABQ3XSG5_9ACTN|nr:SDR family NAD(P)-dependent oxidoreductase [Actinoplanes couchii]MDR6317941.1 NAD(P)-dependent dehydrogenase (short-subunit alcohol dehydrogenase family) [Actinoplanes couchii]GID61350.1 short-chain dehydrogenase [Actinoplanes couchii]
MTRWTANQLPSMTGTTVVITGATGGIGLITARELARAGATVVVAARDLAKARRAVANMPGNFVIHQLDVADLDSVRAFADSYTGPIDILINNAGVMDIPQSRTAQGLDLQTATNYFGPFLLTNLLLPRLTDRVITVGSQLHRFGRLRLTDLNWQTTKYNGLSVYESSKLAVVLFSLELQRRLTESGSPVRSMVAHPGIARTALVSHSPLGFINRFPLFVQDAEMGALPLLYAASQDVPGNAYVGPGGLFSFTGYPKVRKPSRAARNPATARALWQATTGLTHL